MQSPGLAGRLIRRIGARIGKAVGSDGSADYGGDLGARTTRWGDPLLATSCLIPVLLVLAA